MCVIYIYIYIYSTTGFAAHFMLFDRGTSWALPLTCLYIPRSARAYLFPQYVKIVYLCSGRISVDPICPQPITMLIIITYYYHYYYYLYYYYYY